MRGLRIGLTRGFYIRGEHGCKIVLDTDTPQM